MKKILAGLIALALCPVLCRAYLVQGIVTDAAGGAPLKDVRVQLSPKQFVITGADGKFSLNTGGATGLAPSPRLSPSLAGISLELRNALGLQVAEAAARFRLPRLAQGVYFAAPLGNAYVNLAPASAKASAAAKTLGCYKTGYASVWQGISGPADNLAIKMSLDPTGIGYHDFLYAGESNSTLYLVRSGKVAWQWTKPDKGEFGDVSLLSDGNIVFSRGQVGASVITPDSQFTWNFKPRGNGSQVHTAQPIGLDKVLICENGIPAVASLWSTETDTKLWEMTLPTREPVDSQSIHGEIRHIRLTKAGTLLVAHLNLNKVSEYDTATKKEIWTCPAASVWGAVRLENGNTLLSGNGGGWVREIDHSCATKWEVTKNELPGITFNTVQECMRLANGNTVINNWGAPAGGPEVVEVTPDKKVVWVLKAWSDPVLKGGSSTHILDEPGAMESMQLMR
jgi:hypothetical protein